MIMGNLQSKTPPPRNPLTDRPWREPSSWNDSLEESLRAEVKSIKPKLLPNVVLFGPVGAGKSSFINAILTVANGHKVDKALTETGDKSCTTVYRKYKDDGVNFCLRDCMGIEQSEAEGIHTKDMVALIKGHIKDRYKFNAQNAIEETDNLYCKNPKPEHMAHCVVFVINSTVVNCIPDEFIWKIREVQKEIKTLCVPRVLILTKTDSLCEEVQNDSANMFKSVLVREAVKTASEVFNIPEASIHPVKNYEVDVQMTFENNIPLLIALRQIMYYASDRINDMNEQNDSD